MEPTSDQSDLTIPEGLAVAGSYASTREGDDHGLVVLAMGLSYWLVGTADRFVLLVDARAYDAVVYQLALFDQESNGWPPRPPKQTAPRIRTPAYTPFLWALFLVLVFLLQARWPGVLESWGASEPQALFERGEWWRPVTALFLHGGLAHLLSNAGAGLFVFTSVLTTLGLARGWLLLLAASIGGNILAAAAHFHVAYQSIGASTAVFAGIGLLTGNATREAVRNAGGFQSFKPVFAPLAAGLVLLGLLGAGDVRTDVIAHATGFFCGLLLGFVQYPRKASARSS